MAELTLVIGNKASSSWSLRPWLALKHAGLDFAEVVVPLRQPDTKDRIRAHSPSGKVPVLKHGDLTIWDSLAICEYTADLAPDAKLWPDDPQVRAVARAVSAEMHSGFADLRQTLPMNLKRPNPGAPRTVACERDIARVLDIWAGIRSAHGAGGPFLFGRFSIADCMYAPVVTRFSTYGVKLPDVARAYADAVMALPAMQAWVEAAKAEPWELA
ncbi:MAG TPA: glutathione S-transferase family protein [Azospirillaceae bacterium]|nr:glutathione S-transferase family protein [Azospirillaceae bacterium]